MSRKKHLISEFNISIACNKFLDTNHPNRNISSMQHSSKPCSHHTLDQNFPSYGSIKVLFFTESGNSSNPIAVLCAHGLAAFSSRILVEKHLDQLRRGKFFVTSTIVSGWISSDRKPMLSISALVIVTNRQVCLSQR